MSYKCNYNKKYDYIKKTLRKKRTIGNKICRQNCVGKSCKNVEFDKC